MYFPMFPIETQTLFFFFRRGVFFQKNAPSAEIPYWVRMSAESKLLYSKVMINSEMWKLYLHVDFAYKTCQKREFTVIVGNFRDFFYFLTCTDTIMSENSAMAVWSVRPVQLFGNAPGRDYWQFANRRTTRTCCESMRAFSPLVWIISLS